MGAPVPARRQVILIAPGSAHSVVSKATARDSVAISDLWSGTLRTNNETTGKQSMRDVSYQISPDGFLFLAPGRELNLIGQVIVTGGSRTGVRSHELLELEATPDKLRMR
jgi:hypothetical protein